VADAPKNSWGLVQMDRTAKMQEQLKKKQKKKEISPRLWKSDWRK
jgi:hypothetical protein|tara:strand:- start:862 stop:996 length:135 start_codon:yes stop_codon:yes gene_type:complete